MRHIDYKRKSKEDREDSKNQQIALNQVLKENILGPKPTKNSDTAIFDLLAEM